MAGEGPLLLIVGMKDVDADLRRHNEWVLH
jgi:hypothetical protein